MTIKIAKNEAKKNWNKYVNGDLKTDIEHIAEQNGAKIIRDTLEDDISGMLIIKEKKPYIFVNKNTHIHRQRFTIAHEIGHFLLHQPKSVHVDKGFYVKYRNLKSSTGEELEEIEANQFAAEILMPELLLKEKTCNKIITDNLIEDLSNFFEVSQQAMSIRLISLNII